MEANKKALREALCDIVMLTMKVGHSIRGDVACGIIASKAKHALKQPPRNCDVGTAEEQAKRLNEWCSGRHCINCQFRGGWPDECKLKWAQTPYKEGDDK